MAAYDYQVPLPEEPFSLASEARKLYYRSSYSYYSYYSYNSYSYYDYYDDDDDDYGYASSSYYSAGTDSGIGGQIAAYVIIGIVIVVAVLFFKRFKARQLAKAREAQ